MTNKEFRQQAAMMAMQGMLAYDSQASAETFAIAAYDMADAMLAEEIKRYGTVNESLTVDDWLPWNGGECPVDPDTVVEYKLRSGDIFDQKAYDLVWKHHNSQFDIIRYRVVAPQGDK